MREACFCGWAGDVEDREPVYAGDGEWGLRCPNCGHADLLHWLPEGAKRGTLEGAQRRWNARPQPAPAPDWRVVAARQR